jgi:hypothetical protein
MRKYGLVVIALPFALAPLAALADDESSVATLKNYLGTTKVVEVDNVRSGADGASCITYRYVNDRGGESKAMAVVEGGKVLRSNGGGTKFEKAWNTKCVGKS